MSGHVNKQVCVELPLGITCRALIDEHAGGVWKGRKAKAAVPGGISMGLLSADELDTPLDFESLRKPGCLGLGTAAVTVIDDQTSIVDYLYNTCRFFAHESCGQCTPCREGTTWFYKTMKRIKAGGGRLEDLDIMLNLANNMGIIPGTTICGLSDGAAWPIKNAVAKFRGELEDYIRTHQNPAARGHAAPGERSPTDVRADSRSTRIKPASSPDPVGHDPMTKKRKPMATIIINNSEYTIPEGEKLNAIQMAQRVGVDIPYYCWHPALSVVANCRMCEIEVGTKDPKTGEIKLLPKLVPGCQTPGQRRDRARDRQPQGQGTPADDHGVPALQSSARLPGLRPGRRVRPARLQLPLRPVGASLRRGTNGQPAQGRLGPDSAQHGPVHHVHAVRAVHPRDFPDRRARGDAPGKSRRDRHLSRASPSTTRWPATSSTSARSVPCSTKTSCTSSAPGFCPSTTRSARAARPGATSAPRKTAGLSGDSSPATIRWSTTTGSATRAGTATRRPTTPTCWRRCTSARTTISSRSPIDEAVKAVDQGFKEIASGGGIDRRRAVAVLDRRRGVPAGSLRQGIEPGQRAGNGAGADPAEPTRPSRPTRPRGEPATPASSFRVRSRSTPRNARTGRAWPRSSSISRERSSRSKS